MSRTERVGILGQDKHTKQSKRIPGEPFRYFNATDLAESDRETMAKLAVHGDGKIGVPVRTATTEDAKRIGDKPKPSPLV
jgi:hypothetical protein